MGPPKAMWFSAILVLVALSSVHCSENGHKDAPQRSRLLRFADSVGWKKRVEIPEFQLKAIENEARKHLPAPAFEIDKRSKAGCQPGFTGINCTSPLCFNQTRVQHHDGTQNFGDDISWDVSPGCNDTFYFALDMFIGDAYLSVESGGKASPDGTLIGPHGIEILPCQFVLKTDSQWKAKYCNVVQHNGAGTYSFRVRSGLALPCVYSASAQTVLIADGGFVVDIHDDHVQDTVVDGTNGIQRYPIDGIPSFFAFALSPIVDHAPVQALSVAYYRTGSFHSALPVKTRYHCGAPLYVDAYVCTQIGFYHAQIRGVDPDGNVWQRSYYFDCLPGGTPPSGSPPTTGPPPTYCDNGGQLINNGTQNAACYCPPSYTGARCEISLCFNDGFPLESGGCVCRDGFSGLHCQDVVCNNNIPGQFDVEKRTLVFVVRASFSMQPAFQQIVDAAQQITDFYTAEHVGYFVNYVLATFVNGTIPVIRQFGYPGAFIDAIKGISPASAGCDDAVFTTLAAVLQLPTLAEFKRSPIFVFTDAVTNDAQQMTEALFHQLSYWRGHIYTILTDPGNGCTIDTAQNGYQAYRYLARFTQGINSYVTKSTITSLATNLAANLYHMNMVLTNDLMFNCANAPAYQPFFVDSATRSISIIATGTNLMLQLTDPALQQSQPQPTFQQNGTYIWVVNKPIVGAYLMSLSGGQAPCQYRVMARSDHDLFFGTADDINSDANSPQPQFRVDSHIVAHVNRLLFRTSLDSVHAEVTITRNDENDQRIALYASNGILRDRCDYNFYFGAYRCMRPFEQFYITVYGTDNFGATFQRTATAFCSAGLPTPQPPNGCLNGGVGGPNGTCICAPHFYGPKCQQIQCLNGATATSGVCLCPPGFTGQFCETPMCYSQNPGADQLFSPNDRSLTYIIHDSLFMRPVIKGLAQSATQLAQDISQQHPGWIRHYQVITYNDTGYKVYTETRDPNQFVNALNQVYADNMAHTGFSCQNLSMLESINRALTSIEISRYGYMFVFTAGLAKRELNAFMQTYDMLEASKVQVNIIQTYSRPCGSTLDDPGARVQLELSAFSGGDFFLMSVTKAASINKFVPTLYSGNYVYENFVSDCTAQQNFYFPVDSHTQAFTIYTYGQLGNTGNALLTPRGTPVDNNYRLSIWSDTAMNTHVDQVIRPCDPGWEDVVNDGYCYKFIYQPLSWTDAASVCHRENAVLATIFDAGFETILEGQAPDVEFWIGLNDIAQQGVWVWDQLSGSLPLGPNSFTNWAPGQPSDPSHMTSCVIERPPGAQGDAKGWIASNCNVTRPSVCIKKNYNYDYEPSFEIENDLPKGIWTLSVQTVSGPCYVKVYSQSQVQLYQQFVVNIHDDIGTVGALSKANDNRMIAHVTHQESSSVGLEGQLQYLHIYKENLTMQDVETFTPRAGCAFEYISTPFSCPALTFNAMITGIDSMGYLYQRIKPVFCLSGPIRGSCEHGGAFNNGRCYCPQYWTGDRCQTAICVNGGELEPSGTLCRCRRGWSGTFCQTPVCDPIVPAAHRSSDNRTFVLVLDGSASSAMGNILQNLQTILSGVLTGATASHPYWFSQYVGVVFYDPSAAQQTSATITATTILDFVHQMAAAVSTPYNSGLCPKSSMAGLIQALTSPGIGYRDEVFVVTAASAIDWIKEGPALSLITKSHAYVNFITVGDSLCGFTYSDPGIEAYLNLAQISGGGFYQIKAADLQPFWTNLMGTYYGSRWLTFGTYPSCANISQYVQVGLNSTLITVDIYGIDPPQLGITLPNGQTPPRNNLYNGQHSTLDQFTSAGNAGIYTLSVNPGVTTEQGKPCNVKVRGQSNVVVYIAFTQDVRNENGVHSDQISAAPVKGNYANALVASADGAGSLTYVEFLSLADSSLLWSSPLQMRSGCAYLYISKTFTCPANSFAVAIDGVDFEGHPIRSITNVHCAGLPAPTLVPPSSTTSGPATTTMTVPPQSTTTQAPPPTTSLATCDGKSVMADVVFLLDSSNGLTVPEFKDTVLNFLPLANKVTFGGNFVRAAMGTYDIQSHFSGDFLSLNSSQDYTAKIFDLWAQPQTGIVGNNIDWALRHVVNLTTTDHGFRVGQNILDMIVIISSTGWDVGNNGQGFNDPSDTARSLRRAGMNLVAIGYGPNANMQQLLNISPCARYAPNIDSLNQLMPWVFSLFCMGSSQFC